MNSQGRKLLVSSLALAAPVLVLVVGLLGTADLPDPLPSHWNLDGAVDGTADPTSLLLGFGLATAVAAVATIAVVWLAPRSTRFLPAVLSYATWLTALSYVQIPLLARGASEARQVDMPWYSIATCVLAPAAVALITWRLTPQDLTRPVRVTPHSLRLGASERVLWTSGADSVVLPFAGALLMLAAAGTALVFWWWLAVALALVAMAVVAVSSLAVQIDQSGLHTLWGPLGRPRVTLRLDDVASAHAEEIEPLRWGGWGYRVRRHGSAAVVRRGPGLVVERRDGSSYAVTVDHSAEAADVLNALVARRSSHTSTS